MFKFLKRLAEKRDLKRQREEAYQLAHTFYMNEEVYVLANDKIFGVGKIFRFDRYSLRIGVVVIYKVKLKNNEILECRPWELKKRPQDASM